MSISGNLDKKSCLIEVSAESVAAAIKDIGEDNIESKLSLKLLYGLTNDIKHLQYHGIDYLFLKVNPKLN
ncbi:hypothetical protein N9K12_03415 [Methylophilaceae bacterium]|nr:hypothetical protein [Methylophilaceae bacterium]